MLWINHFKSVVKGLCSLSIEVNAEVRNIDNTTMEYTHSSSVFITLILVKVN